MHLFPISYSMECFIVLIIIIASVHYLSSNLIQKKLEKNRQEYIKEEISTN